MEPIKISRHVVRSAGITDREAARNAGRSVNGFSPYLYEQHIPTLSVMAKLCEACDFELLVRNRKTGEETIIDPPK